MNLPVQKHHQKTCAPADSSPRMPSRKLRLRPSKSRPSQGLNKGRTTTLNQKNEPVQITIANFVVQRRAA